MPDRPQPGTLGAATEVLAFFGDDVLVPVLVSAVYDYLKTRLTRPQTRDVQVTFSIPPQESRPDPVEVTVTGSSDDAAETVRKLCW